MKNKSIRNLGELKPLSEESLEIFNDFKNSKAFLDVLGIELKILDNQIYIFENNKKSDEQMGIAICDKNIFLVGVTTNGIIEYRNDFRKEESITIELLNSKIISFTINNNNIKVIIKNNVNGLSENEVSMEFKNSIKDTLKLNSTGNKNYFDSLKLIEQILPSFEDALYKKFPILKEIKNNNNQLIK